MGEQRPCHGQGYFGDGQIHAEDLVSGILGAVVKDPVQDKVVWQEYVGDGGQRPWLERHLQGFKRYDLIDVFCMRQVI